jgi:hypothetical protein
MSPHPSLNLASHYLSGGKSTVPVFFFPGIIETVSIVRGPCDTLKDFSLWAKTCPDEFVVFKPIRTLWLRARKIPGVLMWLTAKIYIGRV